MIKRFAISIGSRAVGAFGQAIFLVGLARALGPTEMGIYGAAFAASLFVLSFVDFGMVTRALRLESESMARGYYGVIVVMRVILTLCVPIVAIAIALSTSSAAGMWAIVVGAALYALGESNGELANSLWQGRFRPGFVAVAISARRLIAIVPLAFGLTPENSVIGMALNGIAGSVSLVVAVWGRIGRPLPAATIVKENAPFALSTAGPMVAQLDTVVVASVANAATAGIYSLATRLNAPLNMLIGTLIQVFVPTLVRQPTEVDRLRIFRRVRTLVLVAAGAIASLAFVAPWITDTLFGPAYSGAYTMVAGAIIGSALSGVSQLHLSWFYGTVTPYSVAVTMLGWGFVNLALAAVFALTLGVTGLAFSYVISQAILALALWLLWLRSTGARRLP